MAKYIVVHGKVSIGSKRYTKGDVFDIKVKDAEKFPRSMIRRVAETPQPDDAPEVDPEPPEEQPRVTI